MPPNYETLRDETPFAWRVGSTVYALLALTDTPLGRYNLEPDVCVDVYRKGRPRFREVFPDAEAVPMPALHTPAVSYGHVNGLGSELRFPERGEVAHTPVYESLDEGMRALAEPVDFATSGMAPFYLDFKRRLEDAFPGERVGFSYGAEGPLTTAYTLRGQDFLMDLLDDPDQTATFLELVTRSTGEFGRFAAAVNGTPAVNPNGGGLCDDIASMVPARLFDRLVMPCWEQHYRNVTTGQRSAHVEDLRAEQLPYLERIGLSHYDPSISPQLNPRIVTDGCRVPYSWRLGSFHYRDMTRQDVTDFVFQSAADGASGVHTYIEATLVANPDNVAKVQAFIDAGRQAQRLLGQGCPRHELADRVSEPNRGAFWSKWGGYKGSDA